MNRSGKTDSKISRITRERLREMEASLRNETSASGNVEGIPDERVDVPANQLERELAASLPGNAGIAPTRISNVSSTQMELQMPVLQREEPLPNLGSQSVGGAVGRSGGVGGTTARCPPGFGTLTPAFNTTRFIFALPGASRPSGGFESLTASGTSPQ